MPEKICPTTGETFQCGSGSGECWCAELPVIPLDGPPTACLGPRALISEGMKKGVLTYATCPSCQAEQEMLPGDICLSCGLLVKDPTEYQEEQVKWKAKPGAVPVQPNSGLCPRGADGAYSE